MRMGGALWEVKNVRSGVTWEPGHLVASETDKDKKHGVISLGGAKADSGG